ncbi:MAG: hypothetical protein KGS72_22700 [Cyanobacteria bacterium REEB67]|nr:hypothetical protein [Cyanobacteria bacterium REEB67]
MPWSKEEALKNSADTPLETCKYALPHLRRMVSADQDQALECHCVPKAESRFCPCAGLSNRWSKQCQGKHKKHSHKKPLIAYLRSGDSELSVADQSKIIADYCADNEYYLKAIFTDHGRPGVGLQDAMDALATADGLIAADLNRFVEHADDRLRELKPLVHHFFCSPSKHLIAVEEGIDTGSWLGQANAIEVLSHVKEFS